MENRVGEEGKPIRKLVRVWIERGEGERGGLAGDLRQVWY